MFLTLAQIYNAQPNQPGGLHAVQQLPASQLGRWLEEAWFTASPAFLGFTANPSAATNSFALGLERARRDLGQPGRQPRAVHGIAPSGLDPSTVIPQPQPQPAWPFTLRDGPLNNPSGAPLTWDHLIYAFVVESTGAYGILAETARRLVHGESLGVLSPESIVWLRNTEELFFRDPPAFNVMSLSSDLRPSREANRRNAYWRMFGMDLPHPISEGWPGSRPANEWKKHADPGVNRDFQDKLIELLRQVWLGIVNASNRTGANPTDEAYVSLLCTSIRDLLHNRRQNGLLAREEFAYVTMLSWFHLTLLDSGASEANAPIVRDLQAQGNAPEQRLANLAQKVSMRPAVRSRELFLICQLISTLLRSIELGAFDTPARAALLYDGNNQALVQQMRTIINLWQSATGQRIKDRDAVASVTSTQPLRVPVPGTNGTSAAMARDGSKA